MLPDKHLPHTPRGVREIVTYIVGVYGSSISKHASSSCFSNVWLRVSFAVIRHLTAGSVTERTSFLSKGEYGVRTVQRAEGNHEHQGRSPSSFRQRPWYILRADKATGRTVFSLLWGMRGWMTQWHQYPEGHLPTYWSCASMFSSVLGLDWIKPLGQLTS